MYTKIWNLKEGLITSVLYERGKNRKVLNLRSPVDVDNKKIIDEIDSAMGVLNRYVVSIVDADRENGYDKSVGNIGVHGEINNDANLDLSQDLISSRKADSGSKKYNEDRRNMILVSKDNVIKTRNRKESKAYNEYDIAFQHVIPELLESIKKSDKIVKISDVARELGKGFEKKSVVSIYTGIRHILFKYGIKVEQCTFEEIDPATNKGIKGLRMSIFKEGDKLPCSIRRSKAVVDTIQGYMVRQNVDVAK
jgi:molecular chaperone GrpE (heat shock protein)